MDLYYNRLKIFFFILVLFISCDNQIEDMNIPPSSEDDYIAAFYNHYDGVNHRLSVYLEFLDFENNIDFVTVNISHSNIDTSLFEFELTNLSDVNSKAFIYEEFLLDSIGQPILSNNIYLYDMLTNISFIDSTNYQFSSNLTTAIEPEILYDEDNPPIPPNVELDPNEWKELLIQLEIKDLNGIDNIEKVKYEIKQTFLEGCQGDCQYSDDCNEDIIGQDYIDYDGWIFDYIESKNDSIHIFQETIFLRPLDGSGRPYNEDCINDDNNQTCDDCIDENNDQICDNFEATDCGRTGIVEFKLIVSDKDNLSHEIEGIMMGIFE